MLEISYTGIFWEKYWHKNKEKLEILRFFLPVTFGSLLQNLSKPIGTRMGSNRQGVWPPERA